MEESTNITITSEILSEIDPEWLTATTEFDPGSSLLSSFEMMEHCDSTCTMTPQSPGQMSLVLEAMDDSFYEGVKDLVEDCHDILRKDTYLFDSGGDDDNLMGRIPIVNENLMGKIPIANENLMGKILNVDDFFLESGILSSEVDSTVIPDLHSCLIMDDISKFENNFSHQNQNGPSLDILPTFSSQENLYPSDTCSDQEIRKSLHEEESTLELSETFISDLDDIFQLMGRESRNAEIFPTDTSLDPTDTSLDPTDFSSTNELFFGKDGMDNNNFEQNFHFDPTNVMNKFEFASYARNSESEMPAFSNVDDILVPGESEQVIGLIHNRLYDQEFEFESRAERLNLSDLQAIHKNYIEPSSFHSTENENASSVILGGIHDTNSVLTIFEQGFCHDIHDVPFHANTVTNVQDSDVFLPPLPVHLENHLEKLYCNDEAPVHLENHLENLYSNDEAPVLLENHLENLYSNDEAPVHLENHLENLYSNDEAPVLLENHLENLYSNDHGNAQCLDLDGSGLSMYMFNDSSQNICQFEQGVPANCLNASSDEVQAIPVAHTGIQNILNHHEPAIIDTTMKTLKIKSSTGNKNISLLNAHFVKPLPSEMKKFGTQEKKSKRKYTRTRDVKQRTCRNIKTFTSKSKRNTSKKRRPKELIFKNPNVLVQSSKNSLVDAATLNHDAPTLDHNYDNNQLLMHVVNENTHPISVNYTACRNVEKPSAVTSNDNQILMHVMSEDHTHPNTASAIVNNPAFNSVEKPSAKQGDDAVELSSDDDDNVKTGDGREKPEQCHCHRVNVGMKDKFVSLRVRDMWKMNVKDMLSLAGHGPLPKSENEMAKERTAELKELLRRKEQRLLHSRIIPLQSAPD